MSWKWQETLEDFTGLPPRVQNMFFLMGIILLVLMVRNGIKEKAEMSGGPSGSQTAIEESSATP